MKGLAFFALSLIGLDQRQSYPLRIEQVLRPKSETLATKSKGKTKAKGKAGRPKGSKNKDKTQIQLSDELRRLKGMLEALFTTIAGKIPLKYLLLDGKFGHNNVSLLELKAFYRGFRYVDEVIKLLPEKPQPIFISRILTQVANIGAIHPIFIPDIAAE